MTKGHGATYRVQLSADFTLSDLTELLPYLERLGIGAIYASPIFVARAHSVHGYDVVDPTRINPEIGTLEQWRRLSRDMKDRGMAWLQDIVPNHMAFDSRNPWLQDIFRFGPHSRYRDFFDIDWHHPDTDLAGKVMAPFLGSPIETCLKSGELKIVLRDSGLYAAYYDHEFALSYRSVPELLSHAPKNPDPAFGVDFLDQSDSAGREFARKFESALRTESFRRWVETAVDHANAAPENLARIFDAQWFRFTHWKESEHRINYRRFFTINGLICLRMERSEVFEAYHSFVAELCEEGLIDGLRIDHIDGLYDPAAYLQRLRREVGERYIVVEKILEWDERLPADWPVSGTTGYRFLAAVNQLFTREDARSAFDRAYRDIATDVPEYKNMVFANKRFVLERRMGGELDNLMRLWNALDPELEPAEGSRGRRREALIVFLSAFPVYRAYPGRLPPSPRDRQVLEEAKSRTIEVAPQLESDINELLGIFLGESERDSDALHFVKRCQQFTGPLAAKGVEDTSFYEYNRLISHNEVGDTPEVFGMDTADFHARMVERIHYEPMAINATATHDTKRGEDARMRINALTHHAEHWLERVRRWPGIADGTANEAPTPNEAYMIYQSLIGAWNPDADEEEFLKRTCDFLQKALREAKVHSNWSDPNEDYERSVCRFVRNLLGNVEFMDDFRTFADRVHRTATAFSLGQIAIKVTAPGIPDIYRGTEFLDLSYVDPDNRRPVDYSLRRDALDRAQSGEPLPRIEKSFGRDGLKLAVLHRVLDLRRRHADLFLSGEYIPLKVEGAEADEVLAYARRREDHWAIAVVGLSPYSPNDADTDFDGETAAEPDLRRVVLPPEAPSRWRDALTFETVDTVEGELHVADIFTTLSISVLKNTES